MVIHRNQTKHIAKKIFLLRIYLALLFVFLSAIVLLTGINIAVAQSDSQVENLSPTPYRVGEKLTYNVSFGKFKNAAYAETYVVSRGKLGERDAIELRSKIKTNDFIGAAFYFVDESRTTFVSAESGFPLYIRKTSNVSGLPIVKSESYLSAPAVNYDYLTLIYQARNIGGSGNFSLFEDEKNYSVSFLNTGSEKVLTDAGEFETNVSSVASDYLTEKGIKELKVNFSIDADRIPVLIRIRTDKGDFRAELASIQNSDENPSKEPTPEPTPSTTPAPTPKPVSTPAPYVENQPLSDDIPFRLGESLEYKVASSGQTISYVTLQAKARKQFSRLDSLELNASITQTETGNNVFNLNDGIVALVNPDSLAPQFIELKFTGSLSQFNQTAQFDQKAGSVTFNGITSPDIPVGTHSLLSLAYAIRSFNLKPSRDPNNPVNDTRVAVFFDGAATVVTIRPSNAEILAFDGEKILAQMVSITTGNPNFDRYNVKLWLSVDENRLPLKLTAGKYQADLIKRSNSFQR